MNQIEQTIQQFNPVITTPNDYYGVDFINNSSMNNMYQSIMDYQQHIENREDSAYQRMVADMKAAGLNPWTGISSGGLSTSSNNAASDALNGLLAGLNYNLAARKSTVEQDKLLANTLTKVLGYFYSIAHSFK